MEDINCPFCNQEGFDLIGLKHHFMMGYCDVYNSTISVEEERKQRQQKDSRDINMCDYCSLYRHITNCEDGNPCTMFDKSCP